MSRKIALQKVFITVGFYLTTLLGVGLLAACDSGAAGPKPPLSPDATGEQVYVRKCNSCHPGGGRGTGPALLSRLPKLSDEQIATVVRKGKGQMPGYSELAITNEQLDGLILYLRAMK